MIPPGRSLHDAAMPVARSEPPRGRAPPGLAACVALAAISGACAVGFPDYQEGTGTTGAGSSVVAASSTGGEPATSVAATGVGGQGGDGAGGDGTGGAGGTGPGTGGGGAGGGVVVPCDDPGDCADGNSCTTDGCIDDVCVWVPVEDGPEPVDDPTDCVDRGCRGGEELVADDDAEDPGDPSPPCLLGICSGGRQTPVPAESGTSCGELPLACDGAGNCVGCDGSRVDECGAPTVCSTPVCEVGSGICDPGFTDVDPPDTDAGDCQRPTCTGTAANAVLVVDDEDVADTMFACGIAGCSGGNVLAVPFEEGEPCQEGETGFCDGQTVNNTSCKTCLDTAAAEGVDLGCSAATPICVEGAAAGEGACFECLDDAAGSGEDTGCGAAEPVCDEDAGRVCAECYDAGGGVVDPGCGLPTPACFGASCVECRADADCTEFDNPNGRRCSFLANTHCGCTGVADCFGIPTGTDCIAGTCGCNGPDDCDHAGSAGPLCVDGDCQ